MSEHQLFKNPEKDNEEFILKLWENFVNNFPKEKRFQLIIYLHSIMEELKYSNDPYIYFLWYRIYGEKVKLKKEEPNRKRKLYFKSTHMYNSCTGILTIKIFKKIYEILFIANKQEHIDFFNKEKIDLDLLPLAIEEIKLKEFIDFVDTDVVYLKRISEMFRRFTEDEICDMAAYEFCIRLASKAKIKNIISLIKHKTNNPENK